MISYDEESLYELEKKLIEKHPKLSRIKPKPIFITDKDVSGLASPDKIEIGRGFLESNPSQSDVEALLKHELLHYVRPEYGHTIGFLENAEKLGILGDYSRRQLITELNQTRLEGRIFYITNKDGEQEFSIRDEPSWEGFNEVVIDVNKPVGELLRMLREGYQLLRNVAAENIGVSVEELKRIEENENFNLLWLERDLVKSVFLGIVNASERWKETRARKF